MMMIGIMIGSCSSIIIIIEMKMMNGMTGMMMRAMHDRDPNHHPKHHCCCVMMMMTEMMIGITIRHCYHQCDDVDEWDDDDDDA